MANSFKLKLGILAENHEMLLGKDRGLLPFETDAHFGLGLFWDILCRGLIMTEGLLSGTQS